MANDTVKIKFEVEDLNGAKSALLEKKRLIEDIEASVIRLSGRLSDQSRMWLADQGATVLKRTVVELRNMESAALSAQRGVEKLNRELTKSQQQLAFGSRPGLFGGQGSLPGSFDVGPRDASTRGGGGQGGNLSLLGNFDRAAQSLDKAKEKTKGLNTELGRVHGLSEIGASLFARFGVAGGESISLIIRQMTEMNLTFEKLFTNRAFLGIASLAVAAGVAELTSALKDANKETLKFTERQANIGFTGSRNKQQGDIEQLRAIIDAVDQANRRVGGNAAGQEGIIGKVIGKPDPNAFQVVKAFFGELTLARQLANIPLLGQTDFFTSFIADSTQLIKTRTEAVRQLVTAERDAIDAADQLELKRLRGEPTPGAGGITGHRQDRFTKALDSAADSARELRDLPRLQSFIDQAIFDAARDVNDPKKLDFAVFDVQFANLKQELDRRLANQRGLFAAQQELRNLQTTASIQTLDANRQTRTLGEGLDSNPLAKLFTDAHNRMEQFRKQFPLVTTDVIEQFRKMNNEVLNLGIFKQDFGDRIGLRKLSGDIQRLQSAGSFSDRDISLNEQSRLAEARVKEARFFGSGDDLQAAQAGLFGRSSELEAQARNAHFNDQFVKEAELLNERDQLFRSERTRLTEKDIREKELLALKGDLGGAGSVEKQRFVLDKILEVTANIGELNADDRELRLKSLQQRLALGESERTKVLVEIRNEAGDSATVTRDTLGPEPTPDFGNGVFRDSTDAFRRDSQSGRL